MVNSRLFWLDFGIMGGGTWHQERYEGARSVIAEKYSKPRYSFTSRRRGLAIVVHYFRYGEHEVEDPGLVGTKISRPLCTSHTPGRVERNCTVPRATQFGSGLPCPSVQVKFRWTFCEPTYQFEAFQFADMRTVSGSNRTSPWFRRECYIGHRPLW